jgi:hypothetical protein
VDEDGMTANSGAIGRPASPMPPRALANGMTVSADFASLLISGIGEITSLGAPAIDDDPGGQQY